MVEFQVPQSAGARQHLGYGRHLADLEAVFARVDQVLMRAHASEGLVTQDGDHVGRVCICAHMEVGRARAKTVKRASSYTTHGTEKRR